MSAVSIEESVVSGDNYVETLSSIAPFQGLPEAVLSILCEHSERRTYSAGQTVFSLGQYDGGEFLVVLSGVLRVSVTDGSTGAMLIEDVRENEIFGLEIAISEADPSSFQQIAVNAAEDTDVVVMDAAEFRSLAGGRPSLMRNTAIYLAEQLSAFRLQAKTAEAAPEQRVYAALLKCISRDPVARLRC